MELSPEEERLRGWLHLIFSASSWTLEQAQEPTAEECEVLLEALGRGPVEPTARELLYLKRHVARLRRILEYHASQRRYGADLHTVRDWAISALSGDGVPPAMA